MYELRTGHTTSSTNNEEWQTQDGVGYTYIIVKKETPEIKHIVEYSYAVELTTETGIIFDDDNNDLIFGNGATEKEAWEDFWENFFPSVHWWRDKQPEEKKQWLVTIHSPYTEWYEPPSPKTKVFSSKAKAEEYKKNLENLIKKGSMDFVSIQEIQAE